MPQCISKRKYKSGVIFYRVIMHHNKAKHHVGCFLTLEEAINRRDAWRPRPVRSVLQTLRNQGPAGKALADVFTNPTKSKP